MTVRILKWIAYLSFTMLLPLWLFLRPEVKAPQARTTDTPVADQPPGWAWLQLLAVLAADTIHRARVDGQIAIRVAPDPVRFQVAVDSVHVPILVTATLAQPTDPFTHPALPPAASGRYQGGFRLGCDSCGNRLIEIPAGMKIYFIPIWDTGLTVFLPGGSGCSLRRRSGGIYVGRQKVAPGDDLRLNVDQLRQSGQDSLVFIRNTSSDSLRTIFFEYAY